MINELAKFCKTKEIDKIVGIDARGFILAAAIAYKLKTGLVIVRKKGKLPHRTIKKKFNLEYATATPWRYYTSLKRSGLCGLFNRSML